MAFDDGVPEKLELLVEGELGLAVLNGFYAAFNAAFDELLAMGEIDRIKHVLVRARADAATLAVPSEVPAEMRSSWRQAAIAAVDYIMEYRPDIVPPRGGKTKQP